MADGMDGGNAQSDEHFRIAALLLQFAAPNPEYVVNETFRRARLWLAPWDKGRNAYPGRNRITQEIFGRHVTRSAISQWISGRRRVPAWACRCLAEVLVSRSEDGLKMALELLDHAKREDERVRPLYGFLAVDASGQRRIGRGARDRQAVKVELVEAASPSEG